MTTIDNTKLEIYPTENNAQGAIYYNGECLGVFRYSYNQKRWMFEDWQKNSKEQRLNDREKLKVMR